MLSIAQLALAVTAFGAPPKVDYLFPAGGQRGTTVQVTAQGEFPSWPVQAWSSSDAIAVTAEPDKGKLRVVINASAPPGVYWLRLFDNQGAATQRPFIVDQLPEMVEAEPNDTPAKPQACTLPIVVNGRLGKTGDVDAYAVSLKAGQTLVASVRSHSLLNTPLDGVVQICEVRERKYSSVAAAPSRQEVFVLEQNNDTFGLDPQALYTASRDGTYLVRIFAFSAQPDSSINFAGGDPHLYRLTLTTSGVVEYALPDASPPQAMRVFGAGLAAEGVVAETATIPTGRVVAFVPGIAGHAVVPRSGPSTLLSSAEAQPIVIDHRVSVAGSFKAPQETHGLRFSAKKSQQLAFDVTARSIGLPLDGVLRIEDSAGKVLQQVDDADKSADPRATFSVPADGDYVVRLRDLHRRGGERFAYWLTAGPLTPGFEMSLAADALVVAPGKTVEIPVTITRAGGHKSDLEVLATTLQGGLPPGISVTPANSLAADATAKAVKLTLAAAADAAPGNYPLQIVGRESSESAPTIASVPNVFSLAEPPPVIWLTVTPP